LEGSGFDQGVCDKFTGAFLLRNVRHGGYMPVSAEHRITELRGILDRPLSEDGKIPISASAFEHFLNDECTRDDVGILFRISDSEESMKLRQYRTRFPAEV
jgi:hypothetical protein